MDTLDFLQRVLPTGGKFCAFYMTGNSRKHVFSDTVEGLRDAVLEIDSNGRNAYFAVCSFKEHNGELRRKQVNVHSGKSLIIDIDIGPGKDYATRGEAAAALQKFLDDTGLPKPMVVNSGNGFHVYWVADRDMIAEERAQLAKALKAATTDNGFACDTGKTGDNAVVLRPVGTSNFKDPSNPKTVKLLVDAAPVSVDVLRDKLAYYDTSGPAPIKKVSALTDAMAVRYDDGPPAKGKLVATKCAQLKWMVDNPNKVTEPLWYLQAGLAAYCEDPEETFKKWSADYDKYDETETLKKLAQWRQNTTGPATCSRLEAERPAGCKGCPFRGHIGSPVSLGVVLKEVAPADDAPQYAHTDVATPKPFKRTEKGIKFEIDRTDVPVCEFDVYPVSYGYDDTLGYEVARFMWRRPHAGWTPLRLRQAHLTNAGMKEFTNSIADQGIVLDTKGQTEYFQMFLRGYVKELQKLKAATNHYATMGWKEDNSVFVLGETSFRVGDDGLVSEQVVQLASASNRTAADLYCTSGSFDAWFAGTTALRVGKLYAHQFSILLGLASILVPFTGLRGATVSFYGQSGSGKTVAQFMQQSVWGDPNQLHFQSKFTQNALFSRFGIHGNLPLTIDEATQMTEKDIGSFLYEVTQGKDKARLTKNSEDRAAKEWALLTTMSTNRPIAGKLVAGGMETDAQLARLLEIKVMRSKVFEDGSEAGRKLHRLFTENYGWAGPAFLRELMPLGESGVRALVNEASTVFRDKYGVEFKGVERYWEMIVSLVELVGRLAYKWEIVDFPPDNCINMVLGQVAEMRSAVADNTRDAFDLISEYVNDHARETVTVYHNPGQEPKPIYEHVDRVNSIRVRIDAHRKQGSSKIVRGTMLIDRTHFRQWYAKKGENPRELVKALKEMGADATPATQKASLGKNTAISIPQCYVIGIDLMHPRMVDVLDDVDSIAQATATNNLISITGAKV